jgi:hypothetical protein
MPLFGWADFENSPVIYDWVHGSAVSQVPWDERTVLPSLAGLGKLDGDVPSHEWLGYYRAVSTRF